MESNLIWKSPGWKENPVRRRSREVDFSSQGRKKIKRLLSKVVNSWLLEVFNYGHLVGGFKGDSSNWSRIICSLWNQSLTGEDVLVCHERYLLFPQRHGETFIQHLPLPGSDLVNVDIQCGALSSVVIRARTKRPQRQLLWCVTLLNQC